MRGASGDSALLRDQARRRRPRHLSPGLITDANTRVLDDARKPIKGLYAVGNDIASIMGGNYPGAGITLGPALTFGHVAGLHIAGVEPG